MDAERTGPVAIPRDLFNFLMGAGGIDGVHFGEENGDPPGRFWWRKNLRAADAGGEVADIDGAIEPIRHWYDSVDYEARPPIEVVRDIVFDIQADRKLLIAMRAALLAQGEAERRREACEYHERCVECFDCNQRFHRATELRRAALSTLDEDASRYLAMLDLAARETSEAVS